MPITITNRANHLVIVELNNGESVYLAPGRTSKPPDEGQLNANEKVAKLMRNNLLSSNEVKPEERVDSSTAPVSPEEPAAVLESTLSSGLTSFEDNRLFRISFATFSFALSCPSSSGL